MSEKPSQIIGLRQEPDPRLAPVTKSAVRVPRPGDALSAEPGEVRAWLNAANAV